MLNTKKIIEEYKHLFITDTSEVTQVSNFSYEIQLTDDKVIRHHANPMQPDKRREFRAEIEKMLEANTIEPSTSHYNNRVVLVSKPDGGYRFCIDYRELNKISSPCNIMLPTFNDLRADLHGAKYFTVIDFKSGYHQINLDPLSRPFTAFTAEGLGKFQFKTLVMGLAGSSPGFLKLMFTCLGDVLYKGCVAFVDDVLVYSKTMEEHDNHLRAVLSRFGQFNLKINAKKTTIAAPKVKFMGYIISAQGLEMDPAKYEAISKIPTPRDKKTTQQFLGKVNYYRKSIKDCATLAEPLHKLTGNAEFKWSEECQKAFDALKIKLSSAPVMAHPNWDQPFILQTDASKNAFGFILVQMEDGKERVIEYGSKLAKAHEKAYSPTEMEAAAIIHGIKYFKFYLLDRPFTIMTDHSALKHILGNKTTTSPRIMRWNMELMSYDFNIKFRPGKKNTNADFLSRLEVSDGPSKEILSIATVQGMKSLHIPEDPASIEELAKMFTAVDKISIQAENQD